MCVFAGRILQLIRRFEVNRWTLRELQCVSIDEWIQPGPSVWQQRWLWGHLCRSVCVCVHVSALRCSVYEAEVIRAYIVTHPHTLWSQPVLQGSESLGFSRVSHRVVLNGVFLWRPVCVRRTSREYSAELMRREEILKQSLCLSASLFPHITPTLQLWEERKNRSENQGIFWWNSPTPTYY